MEILRGFKAHEYAAHSTDVTSVAIGPCSGAVLATGGNDKQVNVWKIGRSNPIWSLQGNSTAIECVCFDNKEEFLYSGSYGGAVKRYDLTVGKMAGSFNGHKSNVIAIDSGSFDHSFLATGGMDCMVKVWKMDTKECVFAFKGHKSELTDVKLSPDGLLLASSSRDGEIRIWDMRTSKVQHIFESCSGPVRKLCFNPQEILLAAATSDRMIKLYDVDSMQFICSSSPESSPFQCLAFNTDGTMIYGGSMNGLKGWKWDNLELNAGLVQSGNVPWDSPKAIHYSPEGQIVAATFASNFVSIWAFDTEISDIAESVIQSNDSKIPTKKRSSINSNKRHSLNIAKQSQSSVPQEEKSNGVRKLLKGRASCSEEGLNTPSKDPDREKLKEARTKSNERMRRNSISGLRAIGVLPFSEKKEGKISTVVAFDAYKIENFTDQSLANGTIHIEKKDSEFPLRVAVSPYSDAMVPNCDSVQIRTSSSSPSSPAAFDCNETIDKVLLDGEDLISLLKRRTQIITKLKDLYLNNGIASAFYYLGTFEDSAGEGILWKQELWTITSNFLGVMDLEHCDLTLEIFLHVLPILSNMLECSTQEYHVLTGLRCAHTIICLFASYIKETGNSLCIGIDLAGEERVKRCNLAQNIFLRILHCLPRISNNFESDLDIKTVSQKLSNHLKQHLQS